MRQSDREAEKQRQRETERDGERDGERRRETERERERERATERDRDRDCYTGRGHIDACLVRLSQVLPSATNLCFLVACATVDSL